MSLMTQNYERALQYAYEHALKHGVPMEIYSRPLICFPEEDVSDLDVQFIATPNISDEIPSDWTLRVVIGISEGELCNLQS